MSVRRAERLVWAQMQEPINLQNQHQVPIGMNDPPRLQTRGKGCSLLCLFLCCTLFVSASILTTSVVLMLPAVDDFRSSLASSIRPRARETVSELDAFSSVGPDADVDAVLKAFPEWAARRVDSDLPLTATKREFIDHQVALRDLARAMGAIARANTSGKGG